MPSGDFDMNATVQVALDQANAAIARALGQIAERDERLAITQKHYADTRASLQALTKAAEYALAHPPEKGLANLRKVLTALAPSEEQANADG